MKKIIASVGIAAVGVATLQAAHVGLSPTQTSKPWSISASLRGFYDDNITTSPNALAQQESYGIEVKPSLSYNIVREQVHFGVGYTYGLRWYEDRDPDSDDNSHTVAVNLTQDVSPSLSIELGNTFRITQEPRVETGTGTPLRGLQDYLDNEAHIYATAAISPIHSVYWGYSNRLLKYDDPGFANLLDRMEHSPLIHFRAQLNPNTIGLIGYRFKAVNYTEDRPLRYNFVIEPSDLTPEVRDSDSHYIYTGLDHAFTPSLQGSVRFGVQLAEFPNAENIRTIPEDSAINPYADANLTYGYAEGSNIQVGVRHERQRNDLALVVSPEDPILDQEQTAVYASINHQVTSKIEASLVGHYLNGAFEGGGTVDGLRDEYWAFGVNASYMIDQFFSTEVGYNFDRLDSDIGQRSYDRNRVYIGFRASY
ncbi:MAG: hypothetical protein M2R45_02305 [Verrucomicrobia subdivision 3 bacterium]|nr:hypothetical protein [Limisphaerales bacterium]MCS1414684.1 hypothetical protein [Limisphaerales bacterium]